jgi:hypothetical protein
MKNGIVVVEPLSGKNLSGRFVPINTRMARRKPRSYF